MKNFIIKIVVLTAILFNSTMSFTADQISPAQETAARNELKKRGLDEDAVRQRLAAKGVDMYNINPGNPQQMLEAQVALDEVLQELESEKIGMPPMPSLTASAIDTLKEDDKKAISKQSEEVSDAIDDGASLEEAVAETLSDDQTDQLPKSNIYGQEVFRTQSIKLYRQSKDVKAPDSYVLGVGDVIAISIWGSSEDSQIYEINDDGYIKPAGIPRIYLKGIKYGEAQELLKKRFRSYYNFGPNQFEMSLNFSRTINISVVGEVYNFGSFNIPAINTAFNALVAAGGPNNIGSVRKIQLMRAGQQPRTIDIYKYLMDPSVSETFYLEENDIINVPVVEKLVNISGAVKRPFTYELLENENLSTLIVYARGFKDNAMKRNIQIVRYENDKQVVLDINWAEIESQRGDFKLLPGDRVTVKQIPDSFNNFVTLQGAVDINGTYSIAEGDRVSDVLKKVKVDEDALLSLSYIKRINDDNKSISYIKVNLENAINEINSVDNILLQKRDAIVIMRKGLFVDKATISINGAVRESKSIDFDYNKSLRISDLLFLSGGLRDDATGFAYIKRQDPINPKQTQYLKIDLTAIQNDINSNENVYLEARDVVEVKSKREFTDEQFVNVGGFVRSPGQIRYDETLTIEDALLLSGGLRYEAAGNKIDIYRLNIDDKNATKVIVANVQVDENLKIVGENIRLEPFDEIVVRRAPNFQLQQNVVLTGYVLYPGKYALFNNRQLLIGLM